MCDKCELLLEVLRRIASFHDEGANEHLELTGRYSYFDEPYAVQNARKALEDYEKCE
jgi:hypothetical protein